MFTLRSARARQTFPSVPGRSSISTVNSLVTGMAETSFASPKMQDTFSACCEGIIRPASPAFKTGPGERALRPFLDRAPTLCHTPEKEGIAHDPESGLGRGDYPCSAKNGIGCSRNMMKLLRLWISTRNLGIALRNHSQTSYTRNNCSGLCIRNRWLFRSTKKLMVAD